MWTQEEENILKNHYHLGSKRVAKLLPSKTIHVIQVRAQKLGIKSECWWQYWEDEVIKNTFNLGPKEIMKLLPNRSKSSIVHRRKKLRS